MARLRFDAPALTGHGFHPGDPNLAGGKDMYVLMDETPLYPTSSGWSAREPATLVMNSLMNASLEQIAGLIAHEEVHHRGDDSPNHNTRMGPMTQSSCS